MHIQSRGVVRLRSITQPSPPLLGTILKTDGTRRERYIYTQSVCHLGTPLNEKCSQNGLLLIVVPKSSTVSPYVLIGTREDRGGGFWTESKTAHWLGSWFCFLEVHLGKAGELSNCTALGGPARGVHRE